MLPGAGEQHARRARRARAAPSQHASTASHCARIDGRSHRPLVIADGDECILPIFSNGARLPRGQGGAREATVCITFNAGEVVAMSSWRCGEATRHRREPWRGRPIMSSGAVPAARRDRARSCVTRARALGSSQWAKEAQVNRPGRGGHMEAWVKPPTCSWDKCD